MDDPLPSQVSQANAPQIFLNEDGSPIQIFTEAGGIQGRPKFMRKLRNHGALICSDPKEAQIILVNQDTPQGKQFIRDWGADDSKVVLHYLWVNRSIEEGKPLLAEDDWGKCETRDDGLPIGEVEEDEDIRKSPLPTPRVTPFERNGSLSRMQEYEHYSAVAQSQQQKARNTMPPPAASTSSAHSRSMTPLAISQPSTPNIPVPAMNMAGPMPQTQVQYPMQMAAMMQMPMMNPMFNPMMFQQMFTNMMMNSTGGQYNEEAFKMTVADIINNSQSQMQPTINNRPGTHSPVPEQALPFPEVPRKSSQSRRRSVSESSDSPPLYLANRKGKQKEAPSSSKRRRISDSSHMKSDALPRKPSGSESGPSRKKIFVKSGRPLSFFVQIDLHNRFHVVDAIKKNGGRIEKDHELADYVILYTANKSQKTFTDLLRAAQLASKIAVPSRYVHDCVDRGVLLPSSDYEFEDIVSGKRKRRISVVDKADSDSDDEKEAKAEEKRLQKNEREAQRRRKLKEETQTLKPKSKLSTEEAKQAMLAEGLRQAEERAGITGRRTPPIPPDHTRRQWGNGYNFTYEENKFASEYAQILIERDHTISGSAIAFAIFKKLPHHTLKSWKTQLAKEVGKDIDDWRKRASIAFRKAQRLSQPGPSSAASDVSMQEPPTPRLSQSPAVAQETISSQPTRSNGDSDDIRKTLSEEEFKLLEEDDLNVISQFFVQTDEAEQEDAVWARLGSTYPCQTMSDWQAFYQEHFEEVQRRFAEMSAENNP